MAVLVRGLLGGLPGILGFQIDQRSLVSWSVSGASFSFLKVFGSRFVWEGVSHDFRRNYN